MKLMPKPGLTNEEANASARTDHWGPMRKLMPRPGLTNEEAYAWAKTDQ